MTQLDLYNEIVPGLWMGCCPAPGSHMRWPLPEGFEFDAVIMCSKSHQYDYPSGGVITRYQMFFGDGYARDLPARATLEWAADHAIARVRTMDEKVLIHCQAGLNRSGLITALALIRGWDMDPANAIALIRQKRDPEALFNEEFVNWLLAYVPESPVGGPYHDGTIHQTPAR